MYVILGFGARERRLVYVMFLRVCSRRLLQCECYCEYMSVISKRQRGIFRYSICNYLDEVGTKFEDW